MKNIAIFGAGGFGREVASLIKRINKVEDTWNLLGFFDDDSLHKPKNSSNEYGTILGTIVDLNSYESPLSLVLALGNPKALKSVYEKIENPLIEYPNIIAPEATILDWENFSMGKGNILCSFSSMSCNVHIGSFNVFNNRVSLGHDVVVGDFNAFMTASRVSGGTKINTQNFLGVSAVVLPDITIGKEVVIGAGSVMMRNAKDATVYIGNPAKKFIF